MAVLEKNKWRTVTVAIVVDTGESAIPEKLESRRVIRKKDRTERQSSGSGERTSARSSRNVKERFTLSRYTRKRSEESRGHRGLLEQQ